MSVQKSNGPIIDPALCRCCRAIKKCRILTAEYNWMGKKEVYADMVMDCYGILLSHVDDNEKDSGVCATCVVRLREAIAFRHQVLQCEELFLKAKLDPPEEDKDINNYENKLKKLELELKTEPKDYNSDHNSLDDRDDPCPTYSDDDADDNKPLKEEEKKPEDPILKKNEDVKSEDSEDYNDGSSSDSDEPIKKKAKRKAKAKANGAKKKPSKAAKKQKADTEPPLTEEPRTEHLHSEFDAPSIIFRDEEFSDEPAKLEITELSEEFVIEFNEGLVKMEFTEESHQAGLTSDAESVEDNPEDLEPEFTEIPIAEITEIKKKRQWVRDRSDGVSEYLELYKALESSEELYFRYLNMSKTSFEELHCMVETLIAKEDTQMRKSVSTRERLIICLRYYRTGYSYRTLSESFKIGGATVSNIVKEVSRALWGVLQPVFMPAPREQTWRQAEAGFRETLNFPNCVGSIGGRHIVSKHYSNQNTDYPKITDSSRHKCMVTTALLVVTDPFTKIVALDIGNYGKDGDAGILEKSKFYSKYMNMKDFLPPKPLPGETSITPHVLVGDSSFAVRRNLLRPFPRQLSKFNPTEQAKRVFNDSLAKACTVDTTFNIMMQNWAVLKKPMEVQVDTAVAIIKAISCLHNYVLEKHGHLGNSGVSEYSEPLKGKKRFRGLQPFQLTNNRSSNVALAIRNQFFEYFCKMHPIVEVSNESVDNAVDDEVPAPIQDNDKSIDDPLIG